MNCEAILYLQAVEGEVFECLYDALGFGPARLQGQNKVSHIQNEAKLGFH